MATTTYLFDPATDIPSLAGKVILITGANTGLGKQTAWELSKHSPAHIYMCARSPDKGAAALEEVKTVASEGTKITLLQIDLGSFDSIRSAAKEFLAKENRLDVLFLNAGLMGHPPALTKQGHEMHMGTNHVGHALLFKLLQPVLAKTAASSADVRVISVASNGVRYVPDGIEFDTLKSATSSASLPIRYCQSKLAALLYGKQIAKHHPEFKSIVINPGDVKTELFSREPGDDHMRQLQENVVPKVTIPLDEGVKNHLWAATSPDIKTATYYQPVGIAETPEGPCADDAMAEKLWEWTKQELKDQEP